MTMSLGVLTAFLVSAAALIVIFPFAPKIGLVDHPGERRKTHRHSVPPIGGIAIFIGVAASILVVAPFDVQFLYGMAGATLLVIVGAIDDRFGLGAKERLIAQALAALLLTVGGGVTLTSLGDLFGFGTIELGPLSIPFTVFAMVGIINAVNMIDGIDGLAGGLILIALTTLLLLAPTFGPLQVIVLMTIAAMIPYMICNLELFGIEKRKIFLGDAGSLLLGLILVWALVDSADSPGGINPVTALWLTALPLMDTLRVMGRRILAGGSPFSADAGHLHHFLSRVLHSTRKALVLMLLTAILLTIVGVLGLTSQVSEALMFYSSLVVFATYLLVAHYVHRIATALEQQSQQIVPEAA